MNENLKTQIIAIQNDLTLCVLIDDPKERFHRYTDLAKKLHEVYSANKGNPSEEFSELIAEAFQIQKEVKGPCSQGKSDPLNRFEEITDPRVKAQISMAKTLIAHMGSDLRKQSTTRFHLNRKLGYKYDPSARKNVRVVDFEHPAFVALWQEYYKVALESNLKLVAELEAKPDKTEEEVRRLEIIKTKAIPNAELKLAS